MKERTYQIVLEGIVITVTKKRIKNMYLRIKKEDGMVLISAPYQMSDLRIRRFAEERLPWIREYQEKYKELKQQKDLRPALSEAEIRRRKVLLKAAVEKLIQKYEQLMRVQVSGVTIRQMKTRWGSCNVKTHHININLAPFTIPISAAVKFTSSSVPVTRSHNIVSVPGTKYPSANSAIQFSNNGMISPILLLDGILTS